MRFKEYDTVRVVNKPRELGPPFNGTRGFIRRIYPNKYYEFIALSNLNGVILDSPIGEGGVDCKHLELDISEDLIDGMNSILYNWEERHKEIIIKETLKKIIEDGE